MPEEDVVERAHRDEQEGKSPSTQAGEFVREEIVHVRKANTAPAPFKAARTRPGRG